MLRTSTDRVSGLVVEVKFLDFFLVRNIAWWSGLVVDVKNQRPQNIFAKVGTHTQQGSVV